jgi:hypothetical protein
MGDATRYKCTARNEVGSTSAEIQLRLQQPPTILQPMVDRIVAVDGTTTFKCEVLGGNEGNENGMGTGAEVEWFRNGVPLAPLLMRQEERARFKIRASE